MCGLAGFVDFTASSSQDRMAAMLRGMTDAIAHRGPDDAGTWTDPGAGAALGFRRLSILDLSPEGHQPMASACGRFVLVFNGEVYNFAALRGELEAAGHRWRGHSDTEILLAAFVQWGVEAAVKRFRGMFAIALWDRQERRLHLMRDRLGKKPLYYGLRGRTLVFGSELKALRAFPGFDAAVDRNALASYLRFGYVPSPHAIFEGVRKLPPGSVLTVPAATAGALPEPVAYWDPRAMAEAGQAAPFAGTEAEAIAQLHELLLEAVGLRMVADVPLGAFLSGGIDSSLVVALMQAQSSRAVRTFSIGFQEEGYDEAGHARAVADHLGTQHTEFRVTAGDALAFVPQLGGLYDEPFADSSQIPTYMVARMARQQVTVALSGDGGDELFGGYSRYFEGARLWRGIGWMPRWVRAGMSQGILAVTPAAWDAFAGTAGRMVPGTRGSVLNGDRIHKLAGLLKARDPHDLYLRAVTQWADPASALCRGAEALSPIADPARSPRGLDPVHRMMYLDLISYLTDDILVKVDRATMAASLEGRAPLLDQEVAAFAWRLPLDLKLRHGRGKWILRQVLDRYVPQALLDRPKQGFGIPLDGWLRGPLREWAADLLEPAKLAREGYFQPQAIQRKWQEHQLGQRNWHSQLWAVLMFQAWLGG